MSIDTNYKVLRQVLDAHIGHESGAGWAVEFGVYSGTSLCLIAGYMPVIGFDSFEGLPEDWRPGFPKGKFNVKQSPGIRAGFPPPNSMIVPGWFEDTAPGFPFPPLWLVHIDCDLYSSTVTALDALLPYISEGTIFVFDEFEGIGVDGVVFDDEKRAFHEWMSKHNINAELLFASGEEAAFQIDSIGGSW